MFDANHTPETFDANRAAEAKEMVPDEDGVLHTLHEKFLFDQMEAWRLECLRERARADAAEARLRDAELLIKSPFCVKRLDAVADQEKSNDR
jgi:hypothetical protein